MRRLTALLTVLVLMCLACATAVAGDRDPPAQLLQEQIDELREQLNELEAQLEATEEAQKKAEKKALAGEKMKASGYIIARYRDVENRDGTFVISRARLKLKGRVTDNTGFTFQIDARSADGKVDLRDAYIDRFFGEDPYRLRAGQTKVPIMYEVLESSSVRLAPERTALARASFPGERDIGLLFHGAPERWQGASFDVGVVNGQGRNQIDANNHKNLLARVLVPIAPGSAYVGYYNGDVERLDVTFDKKLFFIGTELPFGNTHFRAEYGRGDNHQRDVAGWYGQLVHTVNGGANTLFVRYDEYDQDDDAPDTTIKRTVVGWENKLDKKTRVVASYQLRNADDGFTNIAGDSQALDDDVLTLQLQVKY